MAELVLRPSAKINLNLRVGPRRPDGYHDVRTVLQSIALDDELRIESTRGPFELVVNAAGVPADETNLVWRAARALWTALRREGEPRQTRVTLNKKIPVGSGLGGGSADAAAALLGLHKLWKGRLAPADLHRLAAGLGADVPFFLVGGTAIGVDRGDEIYPLVDAPRLGLIIIQPQFAVATADAYRWLDEGPAVASDGALGGRVKLGWASGPVAVVNDLLAPVAARHPMLTDIIWACRRAGAEAAGMTGSGSAVFAVFDPGAVAKAAEDLARKSEGWRVIPTRTLARRDACRRIGL